MSTLLAVLLLVFSVLFGVYVFTLRSTMLRLIESSTWKSR